MNIPIDEHSCSYHCDRPECIKAQRDELRATLERVKAAEAGLPVEPETFKFAIDIDTPVAYVVLKDDYDTLRDYAVQMKAENEKWQERVFEFDTCIQEVADELGACCGGVDGDQADPLSTTQVLLKAICHIKQRAEKAEAILIQHYCDYEFKPTLEQAVELMLEERREKKATEAENAALRKDAERYRWLRDQHEGKLPIEMDADGFPMPQEVAALAFTVFYPDPTGDESLVVVPTGNLDETIDAAIDSAGAE